MLSSLEPVYNRLQQQDLHPKLQELLGQIEEQQNTSMITADGQTTEKRFFKVANLVTSKLKDHLNFFGHWETVEGHLLPRSNEVIMNSGLADCKEFALLTVMLLRRLGYSDSHMALLQMRHAYNYAIPSYDFNHVIVHVGLDGRDFWLDPSEKVSFVHSDGKITEHLAERKAFLHTSGSFILKETPKLSSESVARQKTQKKFIWRDPETVEVHVNLKYEGLNAYYFAARYLYEDQDKIRDEVLSHLVHQNRRLEKILYYDPPVIDRIARDNYEIKIGFLIKVDWEFSNKGLYSLFYRPLYRR